MFVVGRAPKLLTHFQTAESMLGENRYCVAIKQANRVWEQIKENSKEDETKKQCRNIMTEALQKEENWEDAGHFNRENLKCHMNDMRTLILALRDALHCKNFSYIRTHGPIAEDVLNNIVKKLDGNEVWNYYRRELIEIINLTNSMNNVNIQIDLDTEAERLTTLLLPPKPEEIIIPDYSVKDADDIDKTLQLSKDQDFTVNGTGKKLKQAKEENINEYKEALNIANLLKNDPKHIDEIEDAIRRAREFVGRGKNLNSHTPSKKSLILPEEAQILKLKRCI
jgi:hypothetical protein